jgi:type IV secretory pathway component VirB8
MQHEFSPDEARRWDAWQQAKAASARRSDRIAHLFGVTMLAATLTAVAVAMWL